MFSVAGAALLLFGTNALCLPQDDGGLGFEGNTESGEELQSASEVDGPSFLSSPQPTCQEGVSSDGVLASLPSMPSNTEVESIPAEAEADASENSYSS